MGASLGSRYCVITLALCLAASCSSNPYLPPSSFAGCYTANNAQRLLLAPDGSLYADGKKAGTYKVVAPVGGKHGALIEATGLNVSSRNSRVTFAPGSGGFFWDVTDKYLTVVFAPDDMVQFAKASDAACR
jgi:hypothetical protein